MMSFRKEGRSRQNRMGAVFLVLYVTLTVLPYTDLLFESVRKPNWVMALALFMLGIRRGVRRGHLALPSASVSVVLFGVIAWKFFEMIRTPGDIKEAIVTFGDFLSCIIVCFFFVPNYFDSVGYSRFFAKVAICLLGAAVVLHPFVPDLALAGWDKGESWAFSHPNVAAMVCLSALLAAIITIDGASGRRKRVIVYYFIAALAAAAIFSTMSRTVIACAVFIFLMYAARAILGGVWEKSGAWARVIRIAIRVLLGISAAVSIISIFYNFSYDEIDALSSGRVLFWVQMLDSVPDKYLGVGLLPPGENLIYDVEEHGAGIDGLYANILYSEGYIGMALMASLLLVMIFRIKKIRRREFPMYLIVPIVVALYGITETHFFLRPSPLTIYVLGVLACFSAKTYRVRSGRRAMTRYAEVQRA